MSKAITDKDRMSVVRHCEHLIEDGWEINEIQALVGNSCWRIYVSHLFGEEYMKLYLGEEEEGDEGDE